MDAETLRFDVPEYSVSLRARLLTDRNPALVEKVLAELPLETVLHHVLFSGRAIYMPTRIIDSEPGNMVMRRLGDVYLYQPSAQICITYNDKTPESAPVNKFAEIHPDDLPALIRLGELVRDHTVARAQRKVIKIVVRSSISPVRVSSPIVQLGKDLPSDHWRHAVNRINDEVDRVWLNEPQEVLDLIQADTSPATLFFMNSYLLQDGPNIGSKLLTVSTDNDMTLPFIVRLTKAFLTQPFDHFLFISDLGFPKMKEIGEVYMNALPTLQSLDEYRQLTAPLVVLLNRMQKWMHLIYDHGGLNPGEKIQLSSR
ncbi:hypothetical protein [Bosea vestrisii]|uniref:Cucumopine synthase C-terminal helical bundle domain-containing protein n=1 Tax=Bosea vestrisii TaxID=151416 RepID=A0ABW0HGA6_9HYPH